MPPKRAAASRGDVLEVWRNVRTPGYGHRCSTYLREHVTRSQQVRVTVTMTAQLVLAFPRSISSGGTRSALRVIGAWKRDRRIEVGGGNKEEEGLTTFFLSFHRRRRCVRREMKDHVLARRRGRRRLLPCEARDGRGTISASAARPRVAQKSSAPKDRRRRAEGRDVLEGVWKTLTRPNRRQRVPPPSLSLSLSLSTPFAGGTGAGKGPLCSQTVHCDGSPQTTLD